MASPRRVGAETSKTRDVLLDGVERLMLDAGYASVSYRAVATKAGVTPGLVQYYFPTLDDLFVAVIRRRSEQNLDRLAEALRTRADEPLRVMWEHSREESTSALTTEFLALGNHRKSIGSEIADSTERARSLQLDALEAVMGDDDIPILALSPSVLLFVLTGLPKLITLEEGVGIASAHSEVVVAFERYLDSTEPRKAPTRTSGPAPRSRRRPT
jgi:AcrR family transcriptional regulator